MVTVTVDSAHKGQPVVVTTCLTNGEDRLEAGLLVLQVCESPITAIIAVARFAALVGRVQVVPGVRGLDDVVHVVHVGEGVDAHGALVRGDVLDVELSEVVGSTVGAEAVKSPSLEVATHHFAMGLDGNGRNADDEKKDAIKT